MRSSLRKRGFVQGFESRECGLVVARGRFSRAARAPNALERAPRHVLADAAAARRMGKAGRVRALKEFSAKNTVSCTTRLYEGPASR